MDASMYDRAVRIATTYHGTQKDKGGQPYMHHPYTVANIASDITPATFDEETVMVVGLLHDTVEDTEYTEEWLRRDFPMVVAEAVMALTRREGETYFQFISRVKANELAKYVKIADLLHNMSVTRLERVTEKDIIRIEKYAKALEILRKK